MRDLPYIHPKRNRWVGSSHFYQRLFHNISLSPTLIFFFLHNHYASKCPHFHFFTLFIPSPLKFLSHSFFYPHSHFSLHSFISAAYHNESGESRLSSRNFVHFSPFHRFNSTYTMWSTSIFNVSIFLIRSQEYVNQFSI